MVNSAQCSPNKPGVSCRLIRYALEEGGEHKLYGSFAAGAKAPLNEGYNAIFDFRISPQRNATGLVL